jgi:hypothetical protein
VPVAADPDRKLGRKVARGGQGWRCARFVKPLAGHDEVRISLSLEVRCVQQKAAAGTTAAGARLRHETATAPLRQSHVRELRSAVDRVDGALVSRKRRLVQGL